MNVLIRQMIGNVDRIARLHELEAPKELIASEANALRIRLDKLAPTLALWTVMAKHNESGSLIDFTVEASSKEEAVSIFNDKINNGFGAGYYGKTKLDWVHPLNIINKV